MPLPDYLPEDYLIDWYERDKDEARGTIRLLLRLGGAGDWHVWHALLALARHCRDANRRVPWPLRDFAIDVATRRLKQPRAPSHPKRTKSVVRDGGIYIEHLVLRLEGLSNTEACAQVAERRDIDDSTVRLAIKRHAACSLNAR